MIRAILHVDKKWGIGKKNDLMFSLPKDMKFFRETTSEHTVVLGENTLLSFPRKAAEKPQAHRIVAHGAARRLRNRAFSGRSARGDEKSGGKRRRRVRDRRRVGV